MENKTLVGKKVVRGSYWNTPEIDRSGTVLEMWGNACRVRWEDGRISMVDIQTLDVV